MEDENSLYSRQLGIIPPEKLNFLISIIGAGSIGSWLTLCLAKMGCSRLEVWDFDTIEKYNTPNQFYPRIDGDEVFGKVGLLKESVGNFSNTSIDAIADKYVGDVLMGDVIVSAVDNMEARDKIFQGNVGLDKLLIDGRMGGNAIEIYTVQLNNVAQCKAYVNTLFTDEKAIPVPCSHRSVAYNGLVIGGMIASLVAKFALKEEIPTELMVDMKNYFLLK